MAIVSPMEWFTNEPWRGEAGLWLIAFAVTAAILAIGRKRLFLSIPCAFIWLLLATMAIPSYMPARPIAFRNACINNLWQIRDAKARWAAEGGKPTGAVPTEDDLYGGNGTNGFLNHHLTCPGGGTYTFGSVGENPKCSLSEKGHRLE
jgi:hypothetical protein